jgi:hypothetical protein
VFYIKKTGGRGKSRGTWGMRGYVNKEVMESMPGRGIKERMIPYQMGHSSSHQVEYGSVKNQTNFGEQSSDKLHYSCRES